MKREYIKQLIRQGFHVIEYGQPMKVEGDLIYYLDKIDEEDRNPRTGGYYTLAR